VTLTEEYKNQSAWRDWGTYLERLPIQDQDTIVDMGCGIGLVSKMLAKKARQVIAVDNNPELIQEAKRTNSAKNITYKVANLASMNYQNSPPVVGIWSSFVAAYFPDFTPILSNWIRILKPGGWIAIVEMSDLFAHEPLNLSTQEVFREYYQRQRNNNIYDFEMGAKVKDFILASGLSIIHEESIPDPELAFNGPAEPQILKSWGSRIDRMHGFKEYLGEQKFSEIKIDFLECLVDKNHSCSAIVKFILAKKMTS